VDFMRDRRRSRSLIALAAAYVVALQALLLPLSVAAAGPLTAALCASSAQADGSAPVQQSGCPCAGGCGMQCCGHALTPRPPIVVGAAYSCAGTIAPAPQPVAVVRPADHRPQIPRAPPLA